MRATARDPGRLLGRPGESLCLIEPEVDFTDDLFLCGYPVREERREEAVAVEGPVTAVPRRGCCAGACGRCASLCRSGHSVGTVAVYPQGGGTRECLAAFRTNERPG